MTVLVNILRICWLAAGAWKTARLEQMARRFQPLSDSSAKFQREPVGKGKDGRYRCPAGWRHTRKGSNQATRVVNSGYIFQTWSQRKLHPTLPVEKWRGRGIFHVGVPSSDHEEQPTFQWRFMWTCLCHICENIIFNLLLTFLRIWLYMFRLLCSPGVLYF